MSSIIKDLNQITDGAKEAAGGVNEIERAAESTGEALEDLGRRAADAFSLIFDVVREGIDAVNQYNESMRGLRSAAGEMGLDFAQLREKANELSADGLMSVSDTAASLKNLLETGFDLDEAVAIIDRLKESAAYGREESLAFGDAVRSATEGIQSGNSILVKDCPLAA